MAKGYLPSVEVTDAQYEMLNRLLMELCDLLRVLMVTRGSELPTAHVSPNLQLPDLLPNHVRPQLPRRRVWSSQTPPTSPSCSFHHLSRTFSEVFDAANNGQPMGPYGDDDVFCPPGAVNAPVAIRSSLPPRQRRRRIRTNSLREIRRRSARSKSDDCPDESARRDAESNVERRDQPQASQSESIKKEEDSEESLVSSLIARKLGGPICTAVVIVLGWRLISNMR